MKSARSVAEKIKEFTGQAKRDCKAKLLSVLASTPHETNPSPDSLSIYLSAFMAPALILV
jgi:hypothetical protein